MSLGVSENLEKKAQSHTPGLFFMNVRLLMFTYYRIQSNLSVQKKMQKTLKLFYSLRRNRALRFVCQVL